jgi:hypothetical protein
MTTGHILAYCAGYRRFSKNYVLMQKRKKNYIDSVVENH